MAKLVDKNCEICGCLLEQVDIATKYCPDCKKMVRKNTLDKYYEKSYSKTHTDEIYENNFYKVTTEPKRLTHIGFDEISEIGVKSYISYYNLKWYDILVKFDKHLELKNWIVDEYVDWMNKTSKTSIRSFIKDHKYISRNLIDYIEYEEIRKIVGINKHTHTKEDCYKNFRDIIDKLGRIPLYHEFTELSSIVIGVYKDKYNLSGKVYDTLVKLITTEDEYNNYKIYRLQHKSKVGKQTSTLNKTLISLEDLEKEFKRVFDKCFKDTNEYPSSKLFNKLSKHDSSTYIKKLNMRWSEVCKYYGYPTHQEKYIFENYVLKHIAKILNTDYESQKRFPWLIGINNSPLFCDGYFKKYNLVVEVDGRQHRKPYSKFGGEKAFKTLQANDAIKNKLIPENGLILLRIADNTKWHDVNYLRERVQEVVSKELTNYKHCASL